MSVIINKLGKNKFERIWDLRIKADNWRVLRALYREESEKSKKGRAEEDERRAVTTLD